MLWHDVTEFSALGNASVAFNACVVACIADKVPMRIPGGTYTFSAPVVIPSSVGLKIIGSGWNTVLKSGNGLNDFVIKFDSTSGDIRGFSISDLMIDGNAGQQTSGGGIWARGAVQSFFEKVHFYNCYDVGLKLDGIQAGGFGHHNRIEKCLFDGGSASLGEGIGLRIYASDENSIDRCDFEDLGGVGTEVGAVIDQSGLNTYTACWFVNGKDGLRIKDTGRVRVVNCTFDGPSRHPLIISGYLCHVSGCTFLEGKSGYSYVWLNNDGGNIVTSNTFKIPNTGMRSVVRESGATSNNTVTQNIFRFESGAALTNMAFEYNSPITGNWDDNFSA